MDWLGTTIPNSNFTILHLLIALIVIVGGILVAKVLSLSLKRVSTPLMSGNYSKLLQRIVYYTVIIIAIMMALSYLGVDFTGALLAGGIVGIVVGFATQSVVSNLVSGIFLQLDKPISIGDPISIIDSDLAGVILEINVFSTTICTFDGVNLRIPNEKMFTSKIYNFAKHTARRANITVGIAYQEDMAHAIEIIKKTLEENSLVLVEPAPLIYVDVLGDSSVNLSVRAWTASSVWFPLRTQLVQQIKKALDDAGIEIPFPQRVVWQKTSVS
jgi:small-conductance mechanosensitive channel